jgi:hypothetical protein
MGAATAGGWTTNDGFGFLTGLGAFAGFVTGAGISLTGCSTFSSAIFLRSASRAWACERLSGAAKAMDEAKYATAQTTRKHREIFMDDFLRQISAGRNSFPANNGQQFSLWR